MEESKKPLTTNPEDFKSEQNILSMISCIENSSLLKPTLKNRGLINPFSHKIATAQQANDLLNFRHLGKKEFLNRISFYILKDPSVKVPLRKQKLQTFTSKKTCRQVSKLERDRNLILTCFRRK